MTQKRIYFCTLKVILAVLFHSSVVHAQIGSDIALHNIGKMYIGNNPESGGTLYINGSFHASLNTDIRQDGKTILTLDFINDIAQGTVFNNASTGIFEFRGSRAQHITGNADKTLCSIHFPDVIINNRTEVVDVTRDTAAVFISPFLSATTRNIDIQRGRLILQSGLDASGQTHVAHLLVDGMVDIPSDNRSRSLSDRGLVQVDLQLNNQLSDRKLFGFTPPFRKIYSDYFFFHLLAAPTGDKLFGINNKLLRTPKDEMLPGKGYLIGLGVIPIDVFRNNLSIDWINANPDDCMENHVSFARDYAPMSLTQFVNNDRKITDQFSGEKFNTQDVQIEINEGWNYIGNPFTAPIDLETLINGNITTWGITDTDIERSFHIIKESRGSYTNSGPLDDPLSYLFEITTEVINKDGPTSPNPSTIVAPMQMFIIKKITSGPATLTIPASLRTHEQAHFTRSIIEDRYTPENELLLEVKDNESIARDRVGISFRSGADAAFRNNEDASKLFNTTRGNSQLYTLSSDGKQLESNILPLEVNEVALYLRPAINSRQVTLTASRLESLTGVESVTLIDNLTNKKVNLKRDPVYTFTTTSGDPEDRFTLRFSGEFNPIDNTSGITGYYRDGYMEINGLEEIHRGKELLVFDTQGRALYQNRIQNVPVETIYISLPQGVYIVNIAGERFSLSANR